VTVSIDDGTVVKVKGLDLVVDLEGVELQSRVHCTVTRLLSLVLIVGNAYGVRIPLKYVSSVIWHRTGIIPLSIGDVNVIDYLRSSMNNRYSGSLPLNYMGGLS
jgi:hypothetical protein